MTTQLRRAMSLHQAGDLRGAVQIYSSLLQSAPDHPDLIHYLGMAEYKLGNKERARVLLERSIGLDGRKAIVHINLGRICLNDGELERAIACFSSALQLDPQNWEAHHMSGRALMQDDRADEATAHLEEAARTYGGPGLLLDLAQAYTMCGRHPKALAAYRNILQQEPAHEAALSGIGSALRSMNRSAEALEYLERAAALRPDDPRTLCNLGALFEELGRFDRAEELFRHALLQRPGYPVAVAHLLAAKKGLNEPGLVAAAAAHIAGDEIIKPVRVQLHFALGRHFDAAGDVDRAFANYRAANEMVAQGRRYRPLAVEAHVSRHIDTFDRALFSSKRAFGSASARPVFIVGMPRSGTTLTEQILSSHSRVAGAGELGYFNHQSFVLARKYAGSEDLSSFAGQLTREDLAECASGYLTQLDAVSTTAQHVTDKMPTNFLHLGLIALAFPQARIIHCRRDPLDNLLSCYVENFHEDHRYSTRQESLGHYYRQYSRLMQHWHEALPGTILDVQYEALVQDLPGQSRRLLEFCGLEWEASCLAFYRTERAVNTPSKWQVRQPIYTSSIGRWRRYAHHLGPLRQALGYQD